MTAESTQTVDSSKENAPSCSPGGVRGRSFIFFIITQSLGAFNDNVFKVIILFLIRAKFADDPSRSALYLPIGAAMLTLPFFFFSSYAGTLADRFSKRKIIVWAKGAEILVMFAGLLALFHGNIIWILAVLFAMGTQSSFFSPSKYGILPELLPEEELSKGNGILQMSTFLAIILGTAIAGQFYESFEPALYRTSFFLIGLASLGTLTSLGIEKVPAANPSARGQWFFLAQMYRSLREIKKQRPLFLTILGIAYFWFLGAFFQLNLIPFGQDVLGMEESEISLLMALMAVGIGVGSMAAGYLSGGRVEFGLVPIGAFGLTLFSGLLFFSTNSVALTAGTLFFLGASVGFFIVPLQAYLQWKSPADQKGRNIAASNFIDTFAILFSSLLFLLLGMINMQPGGAFLVVGILTLFASIYIFKLLPDFLVRFCLWTLTHTLYRIRILNRGNLPAEGPALLVSNHVSFVDPFLIGACTSRFVRFLMYRPYHEIRGVNRITKLMGVIPIAEDDPPRDIVRSLQAARERLQEGELVCIFAEGGVTQTGNMMRFRKGFERIVKDLDIPVIPVYLDQVWGSIFSFEGGKPFWKWPRRIPYPVTVSFGSPLPSDAKAWEVRQAVTELSSQAFTQRKAHQKPLQAQWVWTAKKGMRRFCMADSTGLKLSYGRALTASILIARKIRTLSPNQDKIGILLPTCCPAALINMGVLLAAKVPVNLNFTAGESTVNATIEQCQFEVILTSEKFLERVNFKKRDEMVLVEDFMKSFPKTHRLGCLLLCYLLPSFLIRRLLIKSHRSMDDTATILFSSGSTGEPKGVELTHHNILSNVEGMQQTINLGPGDCMLGILPFFHSFGFTTTMWFPFLNGIRVVFHPNPLDPKTIGQLCQEYRVTHMLATPTFLLSYVRGCSKEQMASVRMVIVGAEKLKPDIAAKFEEKFGGTVYEGYGCTELSPVVSVGEKRGSVGQPIPGVCPRIVNLETGEILPPGEEGMLLIKGPNVMKGYLGEPEKTAAVIRDGWYETGDIGRLDEDGSITITDRLARFSKIAGEMIPHCKIEDAIQDAMEPTEAHCCVVSLPDQRRGERLVVLHNNPYIDLDEIRGKLAQVGLPNLWIPRKENFSFVESIPVLGSGKVDLRRAKQLATESQES